MKAAIYCRLSKEDEYKIGEQHNQGACEKYLRKNRPERVLPLPVIDQRPRAEAHAAQPDSLVGAAGQVRPDDLVVKSEAMGEAVDQQPGVNQQHGPEDQVGQHHHRTAADREESAESPVKPQPLHRQERIAIVDQMGLDESLDPARTLPDPVPDMGVGLLVGRGIDQPGLVTALVNADAEVAILGHVEGVPAADLPQLGGAEVVAGAAERQLQVEELII